MIASTAFLSSLSNQNENKNKELHNCFIVIVLQCVHQVRSQKP